MFDFFWVGWGGGAVIVRDDPQIVSLSPYK